VLLEPVFGQVPAVAAQMGGGAAVIKYNLLFFGRCMPFWDAGAGVLRICEESTPFELETGAWAFLVYDEGGGNDYGSARSPYFKRRHWESEYGINAFLPYVRPSIFSALM
jgi:lipid A 3-O-deacylase